MWENGAVIGGVTISGKVTITIRGTVTVAGTIRLNPDAISSVTFNGESDAKLTRGGDFTGQMFYAEGVSGNFQNLTFNNITLDGGAVWTGDVNKTLNRGTTNSGVKATGSVLYLVYANADLNNSILQNHDDSTGEKANAVFLRYYSTIDFNNSVVCNNCSRAVKSDGTASSYYRGGVVSVRQGGKVITKNTDVYGNMAWAGGFFGISSTGSYGGIAEAYNSKFHNNYSDNGAVFLMQCNSNRGYLKIDGCEFYNNASKTAVLSEWAYSRPFIISNSSFHDNECAVWDCNADPVLDLSGKIVVEEDTDYTKYLFETPLVLTGALAEGSSIAMSEASITKLLDSAGYIATGTADYAVTEADMAKFVLPKGKKLITVDVNFDDILDVVPVAVDVVMTEITVTLKDSKDESAYEPKTVYANIAYKYNCDAAHTGFAFTGWLKSTDNKTTTAIIKFEDDATLTAQWKLANPTVTLSVESAILKATVTNAGEGITYTYQWYKDGTAIEGATEATYTMTDMNSAKYKCTVTASCEGYKNTSGSKEVTSSAPAEAQVGETKYGTLKAAVEAANAIEGGATVTLLSDVTLGEKLTISGNVTISGGKITRDAAYTGTLFEVASGATLTLDGGLTIDGGHAWSFKKEKPEEDLKYGGDSYLYDHVNTVEGAPEATAHMFINQGTLLLNDATVQNNYTTGKSSAIHCKAGSVTELNGATVTYIANSGRGAVILADESNAKVTIKGNTVITNNIGADNGGIVNFYSAGGVLNLEGGLVKHNYVVTAIVGNSSGTIFGLYSGSGTAKCIANLSGTVITDNHSEGMGTMYIHTNVEYKMSGGEISNNTSYASNIYTRTASCSTTVTGGKITGNKSADGANDFYAKAGTATVTGGTFTQDVTAYLAEGYKLVQNEDGTYGVAVDPAYGNVAQIDDQYFKTLQDAIKAAKDGAVITLLADASGEIQIAEKQELTIDMNDKTLNGCFMPFTGILTLKNGSIVNTDSNVSALEINAGELALTNVNITSARHAVRIDGAVEATIEGGTYQPNATSGTRHALNVSGAANVTILSGTFIGPKGTTMDSGAAVNVQTGATVTIKGGNFSKGKNDTLGGAGKKIVTGGTFDQDPAAYVPNGYISELIDGAYTVRELKDLIIVVSPTASASTTTITVATMDEAVAYAKANEHDSVTYKIEGAVELTTANTHGILDLGKNVVIEGVSENAKLTIVGGGVSDIKGVTFRDLTIADEGTYLPTANEFMYQNYIDCTFINCIFEEGIRVSGNTTITNSTIKADKVNQYALWSDGGKVTMTDSTVEVSGDGYGMVKSDNATEYVLTGNTFEYKNTANKEALNTSGATIFAEGNKFIDCDQGIVPTDKTNYAADGTTVLNDEAIDDKNTIIHNIAQVGETKYETLTEALNACTNGETVKLIADITYTADDVVNAIGGATGFGQYPNPTIIYVGGTAGTPNVPSSVNAVIDLNGHTIKNTADAYFIMIMDNAKVTFTDSVGGGKVITTADAPAVWVVGTETLVTIKGGYFETASAGGVLHSTHGGDLVIEGGEFNTTAENKSLLIMLNSKDRQNSKFFISGVATVTIKGGRFHGFNPEKVGDDNGATSIEEIKFTNGCAEGYIPAENADGTYGVKEGAYVARNTTTGVGYETIADAIAAVGAGDVVIELLADVTLDYNARDAYGTAETTSLTINGNGHILTLNQKNSDWASLGLANADAKLVLNNMTIEKTGYGDTSGAWNTHAIIFSCNVEMNGVTVNNGIAVQNGATLNNVTINEANGYYGLWINGNGQTVTVNGGAINATNGGRGIKIADQYIDAPASVDLTVTDTVFNTAKKAAVLVSSTAGAAITASNVNISNVAEDKVNFVWVDEDWAANYGKVTVSGATKGQEAIETFAAAIMDGEKVAGYYKTLAAAIEAAETGATVTLLVPYVVEAGETLTLDKDVKITYTSNVPGEDMITNKGILVIDGATLVYTNTDTTATNVTVSTISNVAGGKLTVNSGMVQNASAHEMSSEIYPFAIDNYNGAEVIVSGGTVKSDNYRSIRMYVGGVDTENVVTITGGELVGQVWLQSVNAAQNKATLTISGGSFQPTNGDMSSVFITKSSSNAVSVSVTGGNFATKIGSDAATGFISGGTFTENAKNNTKEALLAEGHVFEANEDGTFGVVEAEVPEYEIKLAAIEAAYDAEVVLSLKFFIDEDFLNDENATVVMTKDGRWGAVETVFTTADLKEMGTDKNGRYVLSQGIASGEMTRAVTFQFIDGNGNTVSIIDYVDGETKESVSRTVVDYARLALEKGTDKQKMMATALVTYGGYAQIFFKVDADNPAFNVLSEFGLAVPDITGITSDTVGAVKVIEGANIGITQTTQATFLDSAIYLRMYFVLDEGASIDNYTFALTYTENKVEKTMPIEAVYEEAKNRYYVDILDIPAAYLDYMYKITVTNNATGETYSVSNSVNAWIKLLLENSTNPAQINMGKAMYYYNQCANEFFGK